MVGLWQPGFPTTFTGVSSQELINHRKTLHINCEPLQRSHAEAWYSWCTQWYLVVATLITRFWCQTQTMHLLPALHHLQKMSYEPMASLDDSWRGRKLGDQSQQWSLERRKGVFSVHCFCARSMTIMVSCPVDPQVMWSWSEASSSRNAILEISPMHSLTTTKMPRSKGSSVDFVSKIWEVHRKHIYIYLCLEKIWSLSTISTCIYQSIYDCFRWTSLKDLFGEAWNHHSEESVRLSRPESWWEMMGQTWWCRGRWHGVSLNKDGLLPSCPMNKSLGLVRNHRNCVLIQTAKC